MLDIREASDDEVFAVMSHPAIWDAISDDDHAEPNMGYVDHTSGWIRLAGYTGESLVGVIMLHPYEDGEMIHVNVLPGFRKEHAPQFTEWAVNHAIKPLYAEIPDSFPNIQHFAEKLGFQRISDTTSDGLKNGQTYQLGLYKRTE